jgi:quercetin dioxygenase-like cupin family protein
MVKVGTTILDAEGYGLIFCKTAHETDGELLEMEAFYQPGSKKPPLHYHPSQEENFQVLAGEFKVQVGDESRVYRAGEAFHIPKGLPHSMHNISAEKGHLLWKTRPALNSEGFFEKVWGMENGNGAQNGIGKVLRLASIFQTYRSEVRLVNAGQRLLLQLLAPIGRLVD